MTSQSENSIFWPHARANAELHGMTQEDAKLRGIVAAIMGAQMRSGMIHGTRRDEDSFHADNERAERKKKSSITAAAFDHQVADKMGDFFDEVFLPLMKRLVQAGLSYEEVKKTVGIPPRWGAKIKGAQFQQRAISALDR
jgi:hypothetical protein